MSSKRVLLVGQGRIGREVFAEYREIMVDVVLMVTDPAVPSPQGFEWDGQPVDVAVVMVDTPADDRQLSFYDYDQLIVATEWSLLVADAVIIRSTVSVDFFDSPVYRAHPDRIGFCPEFYGTTRHSRRDVIDLGFVAFSHGVPHWFANLACVGTTKQMWGSAQEVVLAKLAENAYLATKVTFFHELRRLCQSLGASFEAVRELVTADPRINPYHSYCDDGPGWDSHCWNKDVPAYTGLGFDTQLVQAVRSINAWLLTHKR